MKQGYILLFTLILLMFIAALISGLTFLARTATPLENQFYNNQQKLLATYSAKKIGVYTPIRLMDGHLHVITANAN
jgi:hypothetical protein